MKIRSAVTELSAGTRLRERVGRYIITRHRQNVRVFSTIDDDSNDFPVRYCVAQYIGEGGKKKPKKNVSRQI